MSMFSINSLLGTWKINRQMVSQVNRQQIGFATGTAKFAQHSSKQKAQEEIICCQESGEMRQINMRESLKFRKSYYYQSNGRDINVYFDPQATELFHRIVFEKLNDGKENCRGTGKHLCEKDFYQTEYDFSELPERFSIINKANGPNKNYMIITHFCREK